jgi:biliverdin reductase
MHPIRVGLIGTGYAAKARAEGIQADARAQLVAVAGRRLENAQEFSLTYGAEATGAWPELISRADLDLVVIASINADHAAMTRAALQAGKHVVVEYPLALNLGEAEDLMQLAQTQNKLLHVEHIELLSGIHQAVVAALPEIGTAFYARYTSFNGQRPAPRKWTYALAQFGFPLVGALSRIHRLTDLFGPVATVSCRATYWPEAVPRAGALSQTALSQGSQTETEFFTACLCTAQLQFCSGLISEVAYGKGETIWQNLRTLDVHGERGGLFVDSTQGQLILPHQTRPLEIGSRRGLFAKDTAMVLDHLTTGAPLYVAPADSIYALKVADAARQSAVTGKVVELA